MKLAALAGGAMLLTMIVLLALALAELRTSRQHIESQDAKATLLLEATQPALDEVPALVEDARPVVADIARLFARLTGGSGLRGTVEDLPGLVDGAESLLVTAGPLVRSLAASELPATVAETRELVALLSASDLPSTVAAADELIATLAEGDRLAGTLDAGRSLLTRVEDLGLPRRAARSTRRLKTLVEVQRRSYGVLQRSLEVQRKTLRHTRNIDRKTVALDPLAPRG